MMNFLLDVLLGIVSPFYQAHVSSLHYPSSVSVAVD